MNGRDAQKKAPDRFHELMVLAESGDTTVLEELRSLVDARPGLWDHVGDMAGFARDAWIHLTAGENKLVNEALHRKVAQLHRELLGAEPTPLEQLLGERVIVCWLSLYYLDAFYPRRLGQKQGLSWAADQGHQRRLDRAHRRYLSALRTLAQVRRLLVPLVQLNVADKQFITIGGDSPRGHRAIAGEAPGGQ